VPPIARLHPAARSVSRDIPHPGSEHAPLPPQAPRRHAPLANCAVKVGHLKWSNVVDECRVLSRDLKADGWMSGPPRVITRDQVLATVDLAWNGPLWLPWPTGWSGHWALLAPEGDCVMLGSRSR
jgi:hypothetical protein